MKQALSPTTVLVVIVVVVVVAGLIGWAVIAGKKGPEVPDAPKMTEDMQRKGMMEVETEPPPPVPDSGAPASQ